VLDAQGVPIAETAAPLPPAFTSLLQLSLVDLPVAMTATLMNARPAASGGYVPAVPQQFLYNMVRLAVALLGRFVRAACFPKPVEVASQMAAFHSAVSNDTIKTSLKGVFDLCVACRGILACILAESNAFIHLQE